MAVILFDHSSFESLLPLTYIRPVSEIRIGILTITEKWQKYLKEDVSYFTRDYLSKKYPLQLRSDNIFINASVCPDNDLLESINKLAEGEALSGDGVLLAVRSAGMPDFSSIRQYRPVSYQKQFVRIVYPEDIFKYNDTEIRKDFKLITEGRTSASLSSTNCVIGDDIFVEEGVEAECSSFNTKEGPVYLGKNSKVLEACAVRGSFALCHDSQLKMGAKIYGMTTLGPFSRVGGEVKNAVIFGNSSKGHDGYLGNSVVGEWCNIGADSNNSNLKNNYSEVALWDYKAGGFRKTGLEFCGLILGDHSKCGINTMFNTGTVAGVGANIFGGGFPPKFIPDFSWGGYAGFKEYDLSKMLATAEIVFAHKSRILDQCDKKILKAVFDITSGYRIF